MEELKIVEQLKQVPPDLVEALGAGRLAGISIIPRNDGGVDIIAHEKPLLVSLDKLSSMIDARGFSPANLKRMKKSGLIKRSVVQAGDGSWVANPELFREELQNW